MRCDQYIGLNKWAEKFVEGEIVQSLIKGTKTYPDGRVVPYEATCTESTVEQRTYAVLDGAWTPEFLHLQEYTLPNGRVIREYVQAEPWSSGPCYFLALEEMHIDHEGKEHWTPVEESLWSEEEIANA